MNFGGISVSAAFDTRLTRNRIICIGGFGLSDGACFTSVVCELEPSVAETVFGQILRGHITVGLASLALEILVGHAYGLKSRISITQWRAGGAPFVAVCSFECAAVDTGLALCAIGVVGRAVVVLKAGVARAAMQAFCGYGVGLTGLALRGLVFVLVLPRRARRAGLVPADVFKGAGKTRRTISVYARESRVACTDWNTRNRRLTSGIP